MNSQSKCLASACQLEAMAAHTTDSVARIVLLDQALEWRAAADRAIRLASHDADK
jgi:hypothetical protein